MAQRLLLFFLLLTPQLLLAGREEKDSVEIAIEKLEETLADELQSFSDRKTKKIVHQRLENFKNQAGIYLPLLVLSNKTFLKSPEVLVYLPVDSLAYKKEKSKEDREVFFTRKCLDDPEISFLHYKGLLQVYYHEFAGYHEVNLEWMDDKVYSYSLFKLLCYHLLANFFPDNASFKFIIGRWHYNRGVDLLNNIQNNDSDRNIKEIQNECADEMYLAIPWFAAAAKMYPPFQQTYDEILQKLGLK